MSTGYAWQADRRRSTLSIIASTSETRRPVLRAAHRASFCVTGKAILLLWNCFVPSRLQSAGGTVAVLIMLRDEYRTRCRDAISCGARAGKQRLSPLARWHGAPKS